MFAWSYEEMPGLDPMVVVHTLAVNKDACPIKQGQRRYRPELLPKIEAEVGKLIAADFIREVKYPKWVSSIVPVQKKNGQIRICVDFRDLNKACPKDDFPIPISEILIDATIGYEIFSFMDGFSRYNCWGLVLKCYELRTKQHKMLKVKALRPSKHYFP